jgi:hypothetical protein
MTRFVAVCAQDSTLAGRKSQQLMAALEDVEQFHQVRRRCTSMCPCVLRGGSDSLACHERGQA